MTVSTRGSRIRTDETRSAPLLCSLARRGVLKRFRDLDEGEVEVVDAGSVEVFGRPACESGLRSSVVVHDPRFYLDVALGGTVGAGESYMRGRWSCDDLTALVRTVLRNPRVMDDVESGLARLREPFRRLLHRMRENTRRGSLRNIASHYDLGNDFFELFLDPTMTYSCGIFANESSSLEEASILKNDLVCRKLELSPGDRLLEIGTGWGGLAEHAARRHGCEVVTTTISRNQFDYASRRIRKAGLDDRVTLLLEDYRDLPGRLGRRFDKIASIEMIEAVGHSHLDAYLRVCSDLLRPNGAMLLQAILIADRLYDRYVRSVDFIQRYVFPGGCLPSLSSISRALGRATDLRIDHLQDITPHYPATLARWRQGLLANAGRIAALGYPEALVRMWEFYLCYCEAGFLERTIGDVQILLPKPRHRRSTAVPQI